MFAGSPGGIEQNEKPVQDAKSKHTTLEHLPEQTPAPHVNSMAVPNGQFEFRRFV
jgi:hypothetical protein